MQFSIKSFSILPVWIINYVSPYRQYLQRLLVCSNRGQAKQNFSFFVSLLPKQNSQYTLSLKVYIPSRILILSWGFNSNFLNKMLWVSGDWQLPSGRLLAVACLPLWVHAFSQFFASKDFLYFIVNSAICLKGCCKSFIQNIQLFGCRNSFPSNKIPRLLVSTKLTACSVGRAKYSDADVSQKLKRTDFLLESFYLSPLC